MKGEIFQPGNIVGRIIQTEIDGREMIIRIVHHPHRQIPITEFSVSGDLDGTHIPRGMSGCKVTNQRYLDIDSLKAEIKDWMNNPRKPHFNVTG